VRPNASKKGQIGPSTTVRAARGDGSRPNCASALQEGWKNASIHANSGVIWRIPAYSFASVSTTNLDEIGGVRAARCPIAAKSLRTIASIDRKDATVGERHGVLTTGIIARNVRHHRQ
jgi:hypothetical protein